GHIDTDSGFPVITAAVAFAPVDLMRRGSRKESGRSLEAGDFTGPAVGSEGGADSVPGQFVRTLLGRVRRLAGRRLSDRFRATGRRDLVQRSLLVNPAQHRIVAPRV